MVLSHEQHTLDKGIFCKGAILDDGSEWTMLLLAAAKILGLAGIPKDLALCTICYDIQMLHGLNVSFSVSAAANPWLQHKIEGTFTADSLNLAHHTYPVDQLRRKCKHLQGIPEPNHCSLLVQTSHI